MFFKDIQQFSTQRTTTDEGYLIVPSRIARTGIQEYLASELQLDGVDPGKVIKVYRSPEEVFKLESLKSFENKPITDNHPAELINSKTVRLLSVGNMIKAVEQDGDYVTGTLLITDSETIAKVESGKVELSNGYTSDIELEKGTIDGIEYDAVQKNIIGNHVAIVDRGRAGSTCKISDNILEGESMKIKIKGVEYEVSEQVAQAFNALQEEVSKAKGKADEDLKDMETEKEKAVEDKEESDVEKEKMKAKVDDALSKIPTTDDLDKLLEARLVVIDNARKINDKLETKGKTNGEIIKLVVADKFPALDLKDKSEDYLNARFDLLCESLEQDGTKILDKAFVAQNNTVVQDELPADEIARNKMIEDSRK